MENRNMIGGDDGGSFIGYLVGWIILLLTPAVCSGLAFSRYNKVNPWDGMDEETPAAVTAYRENRWEGQQNNYCPDGNPVGIKLKESKKNYIRDMSSVGIGFTSAFAVFLALLFLGADNWFIKGCVIISGIVSYVLGGILAHYMNTSYRNSGNAGDWCVVKRLHEEDDEYGWNGTDYSGNSEGKIPHYWVGFPDTRACHDIEENGYDPHRQDVRHKCCSCEDLRKYGNCLLANKDKDIRDPCRNYQNTAAE